MLTIILLSMQDSNVDNEAEQKITFSTTWWHFYSSVCLVFLFLSYPLLSTLIMQSLIPCIEIDGERYLPVDLYVVHYDILFKSQFLIFLPFLFLLQFHKV